MALWMIRKACRRSPGNWKEQTLTIAVNPEAHPTLVLNADYRPLSYYPLSLWSWQDAIKAVFLDRVNIVSEYDAAVSSPSFEMKLPSVVSLKQYIQPQRKPAFTRFNVFLRDHFTCQYCDASNDLTFDHLIPRSRGGQTLQTPFQPNVYDLHNAGRKFPPNHLHESWMDYLYWDAPLEP